MKNTQSIKSIIKNNRLHCDDYYEYYDDFYDYLNHRNKKKFSCVYIKWLLKLQKKHLKTMT